MTKLKVIYKPKGRAKEYADLAVSLFDSCCHACRYCYAAKVLHREPEDFFTGTRARKDIITKLTSDARQLKAINEQREILLSFTSDIYQSELDICRDTTRAALSILLSANLNVSILTKGGKRSLDDIDMFEAHKDHFRYGVSITFSNDNDSLLYEPNAAPTSERIKALDIIHARGIRTWISIEPAWSIENSIDIIDRTHEIVDIYMIGKLNYHPHADKVDWAQYTEVVTKRLKDLNKAFYLKKDLRGLL